jgi:hypothetical protein
MKMNNPLTVNDITDTKVTYQRMADVLRQIGAGGYDRKANAERKRTVERALSVFSEGLGDRIGMEKLYDAGFLKSPD